ncbi:hypothetical protein ES705_03924 [subsurface metagenome]
MAKEEVDNLKKEVEELKKQNEELAKLMKNVYKKLDQSPTLPSVPPASEVFEAQTDFPRPQRAPKAPKKQEKLKDKEKRKYEKVLEKDLSKLIKTEQKKGSEVFDTKFHFDTDKFNIQINEMAKKAQNFANKISKDFSGDFMTGLNKKLRKIDTTIAKEADRIRTISVMTDEEYEDIVEEIEEAKEEIEEAKEEIEEHQHQVVEIRQRMNELKRGMAEAKERFMNAKLNGDIEEIEETKDYLHDLEKELHESGKELQDSLHYLNDGKREFERARREYSNLLRRAQRLRNVHRQSPTMFVTRATKGKKEDEFSMKIENLVTSVASNIKKSLASTIEGGKKIITQITDIDGDKIIITDEKGTRISSESIGDFITTTAGLFSALGDENRLKVLKTLELGPEFQKELSEKTNLKGGTYKHHTDILQEVDFITREAIRGRYLITQLGIEALKLSELLFLRKKKLEAAQQPTEKDLSEILSLRKKKLEAAQKPTKKDERDDEDETTIDIDIE